MNFPSLKNAEKLKEIIKETTGDDVTMTEVYRVWHYLNKILLCTSLWRGRQKRVPEAQRNLFDTSESGPAGS